MRRYKDRFQCTTCLKSFTTPHTLTRHEKTVHRSILPVLCPLCPSRFRDRYCLRLHFENNHNVPPAPPKVRQPRKRQSGPLRFECYSCEGMQMADYQEHMKEHAQQLGSIRDKALTLLGQYASVAEKLTQTVEGCLALQAQN